MWCKACTHRHLFEAEPSSDSDDEMEPLCRWCESAKCANERCLPKCPLCDEPISLHASACSLAPAEQKPRGTKPPKGYSLESRPSSSCLCDRKGEIPNDPEEAERFHDRRCHKRRERVFISPSGPELRIEPGEPRDYVRDLSDECQARTHRLLDDIDREGSPALVPRKLWLSITEGWFPNDTLSRGIRWDLNKKSQKPGHTPSKYDRPLRPDTTPDDRVLPMSIIDAGSGTPDEDLMALSYPVASQAFIGERDSFKKELREKEYRRKGASGELDYHPKWTEKGQTQRANARTHLEKVLRLGAEPITAARYGGEFKSWMRYCAGEGIDPVLHPGEDPTAWSYGYLGYMSINADDFGNKAATASQKMAAITDVHKSLGLPDPFETKHPLLTRYLKFLRVLQPKAAPKYPMENWFIEALLQKHTGPTYEEKVFSALLCVGFCFVLRSCEYLQVPDSCGKSKPVQLRWKHVEFRNSFLNKKGEMEALTGAEVSKPGNCQAVQLQLTSSKNDLDWVTRTYPRLEEHLLCPVSALIELYDAFNVIHGRYPEGEDIVFQDSWAVPIHRTLVNSRLTEHMKEYGLTDGRFLTHSLRRGGVCALLMAGMSKDDVMHFGRWKSQSGFENYVSVIYETLAEFAHLVYKRVGTFDVR